MNNTQITLVALSAAAFFAAVFLCYKQKGNNVLREHYRDPIWMNKKKMYDDWYPRSNGSIYGDYYQPWDMFRGYPVFPKAY